MSILIKGMKMPLHCEDCKRFFMKTVSFPDYEKMCLLGGHVPPFPEDYHRRADDCPLIELPGHGDLIERDALNPMFVHGRLDDTYVSRKELLGATVVIPAERSEDA